MLAVVFMALRILTAPYPVDSTYGAVVTKIDGDRCSIHVRATHGVKRPYTVINSCAELPACARFVGAWTACASFEEPEPTHHSRGYETLRKLYQQEGR
jgi:hypothetical protein